jgi:hypothetical protein
VPVLLDTEHLSVLEWEEQPACDRLSQRLDRLREDDIATSIVSFYEQPQGWLAYLNRARTPDDVVAAYCPADILAVVWRLGSSNWALLSAPKFARFHIKEAEFAAIRC